MKRILEAINEGLNKSLIDFNDNGGLKKSKAGLHNINIKEFHLGDYVYKDPKLGYNNYIGEKVAVCVSDEPGQELYAVLDHPLMTSWQWWARNNTRLMKESIPDFGNGWENTLYILDNYSDELEGTIWEYLGPNEYIPSNEELLIIYNNYKSPSLLNKIDFVQSNHWTSSLYSCSETNGLALNVDFYNGKSDKTFKVCDYRSVALLHIK